MKNFAATAVSSCGRQTLCYFEPEGDGYILHNIMEVAGIGQVDMKVGLRTADDEHAAQAEQALYDHIAGYGQRQADALVEEVSKQLADLDIGEVQEDDDE